VRTEKPTTQKGRQETGIPMIFLVRFVVRFIKKTRQQGGTGVRYGR
jgi:hypothetical protein